MACIISGGKSVQFRAAEAVIDQNHASSHYLAGQGLEQVTLYDSVLLNACAAHSEEYNDLFFGQPGHPSAMCEDSGSGPYTMHEVYCKRGRNHHGYQKHLLD